MLLHLREQFCRLLDYYGQDPIIVRSSSLLEDGFGNAVHRTGSQSHNKAQHPRLRINRFYKPIGTVRISYPSGTRHEKIFISRTGNSLNQNNHFWDIRIRQRRKEEYFSLAPTFVQCLRNGKFSDNLREQF